MSEIRPKNVPYRERPFIFERSEVEKLRYALNELAKRAEADDPHLRAFVLGLAGSLGFPRKL